VSTPAPSYADLIRVELPAGAGYRAVGRLVLGGLASRFELPVDRVDDMLLAVDSIFLHDAAGPAMTIEAEAAANGLLVRMGPFGAPGLADPAVRRVLDRLVDEVAERAQADGTWIELAVSAAHRGGRE
jgi:hypothetical protein